MWRLLERSSHLLCSSPGLLAVWNGSQPKIMMSPQPRSVTKGQIPGSEDTLSQTFTQLLHHSVLKGWGRSQALFWSQHVHAVAISHSLAYSDMQTRPVPPNWTIVRKIFGAFKQTMYSNEHLVTIQIFNLYINFWKTWYCFRNIYQWIKNKPTSWGTRNGKMYRLA